MPLHVLIATPSGPFGELIRLSLEADPEFHCSLLDNGGELWSALQKDIFQAVIFDCSFLEPEPQRVAQQIKEDFPDVALLLIPPETRTDIAPFRNPQADGMITRLFDATVLPELIKSAIEKKNSQPQAEVTANPLPRSDSWWNAFQAGIQETAASSGMIVQNGMVIACSPDTSTALQQQVSASVMRFWNPADSTDLMRYVKDLVTGQEWMMYASQTADNAVLVLLFLPQTPITRVRSQTLKLAKEVAPLLQKPDASPVKKEAGYLESTEPPRLHDILGQQIADIPEEPSRIVKNSFPVEWFKEADLPEFHSSQDQQQDTPEETLPDFSGMFSQEFSSFKEPFDQFNTVTPSDNKINQSTEDFPANPVFDTPAEDPGSPSLVEKVQNAEDLLSKLEEPLVAKSISGLNVDGIDLGNMQPVSLPSHVAEHGELDAPLTEDSAAFSEPSISDDAVTADIPPESAAVSEPRVEITQPVDKESSEQVGLPESEPDFLAAGAAEQPGEILPVEQTGSNLDAGPEGMGAPAETPAMNYWGLQQELKKEFESTTSAPLESDAAGSALFERFNLDTPDAGNEPPAFSTFEAAAGKPAEVPAGQAVQGVPLESNSDLFNRMNQLQSAAQEEKTETITVALIPRSESMILQRQIAGALNQTMTRLCLAFNWHLDNLTIRPTFMQWTVTIPTSLSPDDMIGIVRKETSQEIVKVLSSDFSLTDKGEFWADQSMSAIGKDFVPSNHWQNFILRRKTHEIA